MVLSADDETHLAAILDQLIPPNPDRNVPGAGELGVAADLAEVARLNVEFEAVLVTLLALSRSIEGDVSADHVRQLEDGLPVAFRELLTETYKRYYCRPDMRAAVGVGRHPVHPGGYAVRREPADLMASLVAPVRARGPVYRDPTRREDDRHGQ